MKLLVISLRLVCTLAILIGCFGDSFGQDLADVIAKSEACVVRIEVQTGEGSGLGSGYVVDSDGRMVTNVHVMAGARRAVAIFPNGKKFRITGTYLIDAGRDVCVAQLDGKDFPVLPMAASLPRKGEEVIALGSPQGLSFTATRGIVSAIRSQLEMARDAGDPSLRGTWVQVDAAISPGNSGGPLINRKGQLVAMSTLASFGRAQNLNFGISVKDVKASVAAAKSRKLLPLATGVSKVDMKDHHPESGELIKRPPVPLSAIEDYFSEGKLTFDDLTKNLRREYTSANDRLKSMKRGETHSPTGHDIVRQIGNRSVRYFFRTQTIKDREIKRQQSRVRDLDRLKKSIGREPTDEAVSSLLWQYGPALDPRAKGSVGFLSGATVIRAFNEHDVIIDYDGAPFLLWVKDSSGLSGGQEVTPGPVFVVGAKTIVIPGRGTIAVTILQSVLKSELDNLLAPDVVQSTTPPTPEIRTWEDKSGKYKIKASFVRKDESNVYLKGEDGSQITVPISKLCDADIEYLQGR